MYNICCSFELSIYQRTLRKCITVSTKILSTTAFNIDMIIIKMFLEQHVSI